nr:ent-kaur-16-ene synthase, chloroplastic [Ipomoea batatas]
MSRSLVIASTSPFPHSVVTHSRQYWIWSTSCFLFSGKGLPSFTMSNKLNAPHHICQTISSYASLGTFDGRDRSTNLTLSCFQVAEEKIRKLFDIVELSVSPYDTAWVAMVPSPHSPGMPCFPECVDWVLNNQNQDGSWGLHHTHPMFLKEALLSTLACVLALKRWDVGEEQINKGLLFIELNFPSAADNDQLCPTGFDIIFPGMLNYLNDSSLKLNLEPRTLNSLHHKRDVELSRCMGSTPKELEAYLAYVSEGLGPLQDWEMAMKYQRKNGSLFNSPSTTAAAFIHHHDPGCLSYLHSVLKIFGNKVPTVYPLDVYARLCVVDNVEKLGINRHFNKGIRNVLDETYRRWLQGDEEIFMDASTCAMAFRILRTNGYSIPSGPLSQFLDESINSIACGRPKDAYAILDLYQALEVICNSDEYVSEKHNRWYENLRQELSSDSLFSDIHTRQIHKQVEDAVNFPFYANLERIANRRYIEHYNVENTRFSKTSYCSSNFSNQDFLTLAVEDFNLCQSIHREELKQLERWVVKNRLDTLKFARQKSAYCYFSAAATLFPPELSDARISWAQNGVLTTVVDDFFDVGGSIEELKNLIHLVEKWNVNVSTDCCSEEVQIIFSALHSTISEIGEKAFRWQERDVMSHIIEIWLNLLNSMLREAEWTKDMTVPTLDDYMENGYVSFALGPIVLPALYLVGPKLSEEIVQHPEYHHLFNLMSTCGRLLNDFRGFERESKEGKLNALSLRIACGNGSVTEEAAIGEMTHLIDAKRRELLRLVLQDSVVPRDCKDLFWKMSKVVHQFYVKDDGFTSQGLIGTVKAILHDPIDLHLI